MNGLPKKTVTNNTKRLKSAIETEGAGQSLSPHYLFPRCPGTFLLEGYSFRGTALSPLHGREEINMVVLQTRAEFLSGRER